MDPQLSNATPRFPWWVLLAPLVVLAAVPDLLAPDEPRYAMIAKWIYEHGEFLILRRCGELYPDKPPFVYWIAGLCGALTDWNVFAMRTLSIAATAGTAWMTSRLARRWFGELEAQWAPVLFLGFALVFWLGGRLQLDPTVAFGCIGALYFASSPAASAREASRQALLAGVCGGVAMFAKGPPVLISIGLPLLLWRVSGLRAEGARASRLSIAAAIALTVLPVATWAVLAALREPALWRSLFFEQHIQRAAQGTHHKGPPWQPLFEVPMYLMPWTVPVVLGLVAAIRAGLARLRGEAHDTGLVFAGLWFVGLFVFFSVIPAKRELYLLPAYPACALLGARWLANALRRASVAGWIASVPFAFFFVVGGVLACALPIANSLATPSPELRALLELARSRADLQWRFAFAALPFFVGIVLAWRALARRDFAGWARNVASAWALGLIAVLALVGPVVAPLASDRGTAALLASLPQKPSEIPCYGTAADGVRFYGGGPCVQAENSGFAGGDAEARLAREGADFLALVETPRWDKLAPEKQALYAVLAHTRTGSREIVVLGRAR